MSERRTTMDEFVAVRKGATRPGRTIFSSVRHSTPAPRRGNACVRREQPAFGIPTWRWRSMRTAAAAFTILTSVRVSIGECVPP